MSEGLIRDYVRRRAQVAVPPDLIATITLALDDVEQRRGSRFLPPLPVAPALATVGLVVVLAVILAHGLPAGLAPSGSASASPTASPAQIPTASPTARASGEPSSSPSSSPRSLAEPGATTTIPAAWSDGPFGTIMLLRGPDTGGYPLVVEPSSQTHFFIEVQVTYELDRIPDDSEWGGDDWRVEATDGSLDVDGVTPFRSPGCQGMGQWPGATAPEDRYSGCLLFAIPRQVATRALELVYQPPWAAGPVERIPLRYPGPPPEPVEAQWPRPDPVYVTRPGLPFAVYDHPEADALFADPDTCTNPVGGYSVAFPDGWYTNTAIGDVPACSWFSPTVFQATAGGPRPAEIAIEIRVFEGAVGIIWVDLYREEVLVDGIRTSRSETGMTKDPETPTNTFQYSYVGWLDDDDEGRKLWAFTGTEHGGEYELNRAVLDRIMASLEFED